MLTFNEDLQASLLAAPSKNSWSEALILALGATKTLKIYHDTNNLSENPAVSGVVVFSASLTGQVSISGGNIKSLGLVSNVTVRTVVDLLTGSSVLRIEGGGNWIQGTVGLSRAAQIAGGVTVENVKTFDFSLSANPTSASGMAFGSGAGILAPKFLPSGTGPVAPGLTANSVVAFRVIDYADELNPKIAGTGYINFRDTDIVLDRPWMASQYGDVRHMRTDSGGGVVLGTGGDAFIFGASVYHQHAGTNSEASVPLQQVEIRRKPYGRWASYPFKRDLNLDYDTMIPPPHKVELLRADGTIVDVIEMYSTRDINNTPGSGRPINFEGQQMESRTTEPLKPFSSTTHILSWWSHRPRYHNLVSHFIPGVGPGAMSQLNVREKHSQNECYPPLTGNLTGDGINVWRMAPKWSRAMDEGFDTTAIDPFVQVTLTANGTSQTFGYGYEPGSTCTHTTYMAPGGSRADRAAWPTAIITWASNKNGIRPHGNVPYAEIMHHWNMGYFNIGQHYFTDVETGAGILKQKILGGEICYNDVYYAGANQNYRPDIDNNAIRLLSPTAGNNVSRRDKNGRRFNNDFARDLQHNHNTAATGAYTYVSTAHVMAAKHSFTSNILANWGYSQSKFSKSDFLCRQHAWYNWQFVNAWIVATSDPRGFTSLEIESMWQKHLEAVYDAVYPAYQDSGDLWGQLLRQLGLGGKGTVIGSNTKLEFDTDSKAFYWGQVLLLMKQTGAFTLMKSKSSKCSAILDLTVVSLAKYAVGSFVDANGRPDKLGTAGEIPTANLFGALNWGQIVPPEGGADWLRDVEGSLRPSTGNIDAKNTMHFRAQYVHILKDYFSEYNFPRVQDAVNIADGFYQTLETEYAAGRSYYFAYRFSMMGLFNPPDYVGPPN